MVDESPQRRCAWTFALGAALILTLGVPALSVSQNLSNASIDGTVTDESGAALPGVTVSVSSPALQVPLLTQITDGEGRYRFIDLPRGTYQVRFELGGFEPLLRTDLVVNAGFAARVNVQMKVGTLQETITVSGASPVVDLTTTRGGQNVSTDLLSFQLPGLKQMADVIQMSPGMHATDGYKPGAIGLNARARFNTYGIASGNTNVTVMVDGFKIIANSIPDLANSQEIDVRSYGNSAEVKEAGAMINVVTKSGGNDFHGRYSEAYMVQPGNNLSDELAARGLRIGSELKYFNDASADLGGRIVRDRLWFFGSYRDRRNKTTRPGLQLDAGPDGRFLTGDEPPAYPKATLANPTIKGQYQVTKNYQLVADYAREVTKSDADSQNTPFGAQPTATPNFALLAFEATQVFKWVPTRWKGEVKGTPTSNVLFDMQYGRSTYLLNYAQQPSCNNEPGKYNRNTLLLTGCGVQRESDFTMWVGDASMTWVPSEFFGGDHQFKIGYQLSRRNITGNAEVTPSGNYNLMFDTVNGVPNTGVQFEYNNAPVEPNNWDNVYSAYVADQWRLGDRLTLNLGMRWDYQHSFVPEQTRPAGPWVPAETFPRVEVGKWHRFAPRAAFAWDLTGSGKVVAKATYGKFNTEAALAGDFNKYATFTTQFLWNDRNRDGQYQPGEVNLDLNGPDFLTTGSAANNRINPDLRLADVHEGSASIEMEVAPNLAVRGLWVLKYVTNDYSTINVLRPYSAFNIPIDRTDPGPDGVLGTSDDGGRVTIYDFDPAFRGAAFQGNMAVNRPEGRNDYYNSFEGSITRRLANSWSVLAAYTATKYHRYLVGIPQSPNDDYFDLDNAWRWNVKLNGNYNFPKDITLGGIVQVLNGALGQRSFVFRATDPSGLPLRQLGQVNLRLEEFGSQREAAQVTFNARLSKQFVFGGRRLNLAVDALNVTNTNAPTAATFVSGPSFGRVNDILPPRTVRFGVTFDF